MSFWKRIVRAVVRVRCPDCDGWGFNVGIKKSDYGCIHPCKLCRGTGRI